MNPQTVYRSILKDKAVSLKCEYPAHLFRRADWVWVLFAIRGVIFFLRHALCFCSILRVGGRCMVVFGKLTVLILAWYDGAMRFEL